MRRSLLILVALASVAGAKPGLLWTPAQIACPERQAPAGLVQAVVKPALPGAPEGTDLSDETVDQVAALATRCADRTRVSEARLDAYLQLVTLQLTASGMAAELKARGLDPVLVGSVMAVGPGRANPDYDQFNDADATRLVRGLKARGVDTAALPHEIWQIVGSYISTASRAYREVANAG